MYFPSTEPSYFKEFQNRLKKAKSRVSGMPLEFDEQGTPGIISVCSPDAAIRERAIAACRYTGGPATLCPGRASPCL